MYRNYKITFFIATCAVLVILSCQKLNLNRDTKINIGEITQEDYNTYHVSAQIVDVGNGVENYGHCWGINQNPNTTDKHTSFGKTPSSKTFISKLDSLEPNKHYFVRAYIFDGSKFHYSKELTILTDNMGLPTISLTIDSINSTSIAFTYNILNEGGNSILERGICWSKSINPSIEDDMVLHNNASVTVSGQINNLRRANIYYLRAFSTNKFGTGYSEQVTIETPPELAEVELLNVSEITSASVLLEGKIINDGGSQIFSKGYCWSTSSNPTIDDHLITNNEDVNIFTSSVSDLEEITRYYIRAFVTNSVGTSYSKVNVFRTLSSNNVIIDEREGQAYRIVQIGKQWWMAENLNYDTKTSGSVYYNNDHQNFAPVYGLLYSWMAAVENSDVEVCNSDFVRGACPCGWHIPDIEEWKELINHMGTDAGGKMKVAGTQYWKSPNEGATSQSGFSVLPAGTKNMSGTFEEIGHSAYFWTATSRTDYKAGFIALHSGTSGVFIYPDGTKFFHLSVRCIKD